MQKIYLAALGAFSLMSSMTYAQLNVEDRLFDFEAQINTLKQEVESLKASSMQNSASAFNPSISVIGDLLGQYGFGVSHHDHKHDEHGHGHSHSHAHEFENGAFVREVEVEFRADISPGFDGLVAAAFEQHSMNDFALHIEEAYARYKGPVELRMGRFKTALGRMNRVHRHNIPQITYPLALRRFLGEEGYASQGLSLNGSHAFSDQTALSYVVEGVMGNRLPMQEKGAEKIPNAIAHAWWHQQVAPANFLDLGLSGLVGRQGKSGSGAFWLFGGDVHYSYIPSGYGQDPLFLFGLESYVAKGQRTLEDKTKEAFLAPGGFTWAQTRLIGSSFLGLRYDIAPQDADIKHLQHALGGYVGYYFSEFLRLRFGYEHVMPSIKSFDGDHRLLLSLNFVLGSHPVEPYFANR